MLTCCSQDCGHPAYLGNYISFYFTIEAHYPHLRLIANCPLGDAAPTEIFDWHMYTTADDLFSKRNDFNAMVPGRDPQVFVSEYAVNIAAGWGNLKVRATPPPPCICHACITRCLDSCQGQRAT